MSSLIVGISTAAVSLGATALSTGLSMYGQQQQAGNARRIGAYNAAIQEQNADVQAMMTQYQYGMDATRAQAQYDAGMMNAQSIANQVPGIEAQSREQISRMRDQQDRVIGSQRAAYGHSGVTIEGSPLEVLADTARQTELGIQDEAYKAELMRRDKLREAEMARYQAGFSLLDAAQAKYMGQIAGITKQIGYQGANMTRMQAASDAQGLQMQSYATLASGIGSAASTIGGAAVSAYRPVNRTSYPGGPFNPLAPVRRATAVN